MTPRSEIAAAISIVLSFALAVFGAFRGWDPAITVGSLVIVEINWAVLVVLGAMRGKS